jgi:hypothetical protein
MIGEPMVAAGIVVVPGKDTVMVRREIRTPTSYPCATHPLSCCFPRTMGCSMPSGYLLTATHWFTGSGSRGGKQGLEAECSASDDPQV